MPTKWLQDRTNGSKNAPGIVFEGPGVDPNSQRGSTSGLPGDFISQKACTKSFGNSQFPHEPVNVFFI